jgi:hypothetical protein
MGTGLDTDQTPIAPGMFAQSDSKAGPFRHRATHSKVCDRLSAVEETERARTPD